MVQVVGEDPKAFKQVTCEHCAAILQYTLHEVKRRDGKDYSGGADGEEWINCPRCSNKVVLKSW